MAPVQKDHCDLPSRGSQYGQSHWLIKGPQRIYSNSADNKGNDKGEDKDAYAASKAVEVEDKVIEETA